MMRKGVTILLIVSFLCGSAFAQGRQTPNGLRILAKRCGSCHGRLPDGTYTRLTDIRKSPEGWDMTIQRMAGYHQVEIAPEERAVLLKYLADTQGLAPEESGAYRYVLERRPNYIEHFPDERIGLMCGSCHTFARPALQRRSQDEWLKLMHFHLGQFPTLEYQSRLRSIEWWKIATSELPQQLARLFPAEDDAWKKWRQHQPEDLSGEWIFAGREAGTGDLRGTLTVAKAGGADTYTVKWTVVAPDDKSASGAGSAIVYTGYEWRASVTLDGAEVRQVFAVSPAGDAMSGRWFYRDHDERGADIRAVRVGPGTSTILAVEPPAIRVGSRTKMTIVGAGLNGEVSLGDGVKVVETLSSDPDHVVVTAEADSTAADGTNDVSVGGVTGTSMLTVYHKIDSVRIEPDYAIARVGGNGGPIAPVNAQFEAVAYLNGPDGKPGTADDIRIGVVPATWSVAPFDDTAADMQDVKFAGHMDPATGLFTPAGAGPNPQRRYGTNNTGNLKVLAGVSEDGAAPKAASAQLIVTVQRWVDPPLR